MTETLTKTHRGGCLCGAVRYTVEGPPAIVAQCHCEACQKWSGTGHTISATFAAADLSLQGETAEFRYMSENGNEVTRLFCPRCGSPLLGRNTGLVGYLTIPLGTMDDVPDWRPQVAVFTRNRKHWDGLPAEAARFEAQPAWRPAKDG
ncbi:GFA family protein [Oceanibacterium hippocampi]|uniref:Glutathione-dependent formaldehyde-activating enzyme n=1 Tax=Oceanibacterium hippocampi TaxID=745714 RepID=A0A1Y5T7R9_9PROT|nr:GFA family protein [Oceanibacterium hippocampi]SLN57673.1 Glutathione-dependent formaldehyde-activating enzyme [Oceanibacterium hippocampi]